MEHFLTDSQYNEGLPPATLREW